MNLSRDMISAALYSIPEDLRLKSYQTLVNTFWPKRIRKRLGFVQLQIAERLGLTRQAVSYWENHAAKPLNESHLLSWLDWLCIEWVLANTDNDDEDDSFVIYVVRNAITRIKYSRRRGLV